MAITVYGVEANLDILQWSGEAYAAQTVSPRPDGVLSGFVVSVATGDRALSVSANGHAYVPGVRIVSDAPVTLNLDSNASGSARIDTIVLQVDWSGTASTAGSVAVVKGTPGAPPVRPSVTREWGVLWQIPLAHVRVANSAGQLVAGNVTNAYPQADTGRVALALPGGYEQGASVLSVRRRAGVVSFGGVFKRTAGNIGLGGSGSLGAVVPEGFRPSRTVTTVAVIDPTSGAKTIAVLVGTDGVVDLYPISGNFATGNRIYLDTTWLAED